MKTEHTKTTITGTITNDAWGGNLTGHDEVRYISDNEDHDVHDICEILGDIGGRKVKITIETID
jgi:hypothetical protein